MASPNAQTLEEILAQIRAEWPPLASMGVESLGIFGSRVHGTARPDSDVDILVNLAPRSDLLDLIGVKMHLEAILGLSVDITTESGLRPELREAVMKDVRYAA